MFKHVSIAACVATLVVVGPARADSVTLKPITFSSLQTDLKASLMKFGVKDGVEQQLFNGTDTPL